MQANPEANFDTDDLGIDVDISELESTISSGIAKVVGGAPVTSLDQHVAWDLYGTFKALPDLYTSDIRLWQWLTLICFRDFAEARTGNAIASITQNEDFKRVLGSISLNGMNRQVMWKLFLAARALGSEALVRTACNNQDRLVSVFERHIGKNETIARALIESVKNSGTTEIQKRITRVNAIGESRLLDYLDGNEINHISTEI